MPEDTLVPYLVDDLMLHTYCFNIPQVIGLMSHISKRDSSSVKKDLETLMSMGSYLDGWKEIRYKSWLHDLFAINGYTAITERESGDGRMDLLVEGFNGKPSIVFEFKVDDPESEADLDILAEEGVKQIKDKHYTKSSGMRKCIALSVAFRKKACAVRFVD